MAGKFNGTVQKLIIIGTPNKDIQHRMDVSLSITTADIPSTDADSGGWEEFLPGLRNATIKLTGRTNYTTAAGKAGVAELVTAALARAFIQLQLTTELTGDISLSGKYMLTQFTPVSAAAEGEATYTIDAKLSGPLVQAIIA